MGDRPWAREPGAWDAWVEKHKRAGVNGNGHGKSLAIEAQRLLPTPVTDPASGNGHARDLAGETRPDRWGAYTAAIARWEAVVGRPAPDPTEPAPRGGRRLSPVFVEWMMGLPVGWLTDPAIWEGFTDGKGRVLTGGRLASAARNAMLKALGNGVVPQQAAHALRTILAWWADLEAAS